MSKNEMEVTTTKENPQTNLTKGLETDLEKGLENYFLGVINTLIRFAGKNIDINLITLQDKEYVLQQLNCFYDQYLKTHPVEQLPDPEENRIFWEGVKNMREKQASAFTGDLGSRLLNPTKSMDAKTIKQAKMDIFEGRTDTEYASIFINSLYNRVTFSVKSGIQPPSVAVIINFMKGSNEISRYKSVLAKDLKEKVGIEQTEAETIVNTLFDINPLIVSNPNRVINAFRALKTAGKDVGGEEFCKLMARIAPEQITKAEVFLRSDFGKLHYKRHEEHTKEVGIFTENTLTYEKFSTLIQKSRETFENSKGAFEEKFKEITNLFVVPTPVPDLLELEWIKTEMNNPEKGNISQNIDQDELKISARKEFIKSMREFSKGFLNKLKKSPESSITKPENKASETNLKKEPLKTVKTPITSKPSILDVPLSEDTIKSNLKPVVVHPNFTSAPTTSATSSLTTAPFNSTIPASNPVSSEEGGLYVQKHPPRSPISRSHRYTGPLNKHFKELSERAASLENVPDTTALFKQREEDTPLKTGESSVLGDISQEELNQLRRVSITPELVSKKWVNKTDTTHTSKSTDDLEGNELRYFKE